ncbi:hypothetical protein UlMin_014636 [Ulmus minor]
MTTRAKSGIFKPKAFFHAKDLNIAKPSSPQEALTHPSWKQAMDDEYKALLLNKTWTLVPYSSTYNIVGNKWVYKLKRNSYGSIHRYKARLVAKGFHQTPGVDYFETFSPVVKTSTIRIILTLAISKGWNIRQLDINSAFLNGKLQESVYMEQPEGYIDASKPHLCANLTKPSMV